MIRFHGKELSPQRPNPKLEDRPFSAVATAYSIYLQLPSILDAVPLLQPEDVSCHGDMSPFITWQFKNALKYFLYMNFFIH
jgi:hypothetical protein